MNYQQIVHVNSNSHLIPSLIINCLIVKNSPR